jgi:hypothetical protein
MSEEHYRKRLRNTLNAGLGKLGRTKSFVTFTVRYRNMFSLRSSGAQ